MQLVLVAAYDCLLHAFIGRTLGKAIAGVTVLRAAPAGQDRVPQRLGLALAARRTALTVLLPGVGWLLLLWATISLSLLPALLGVVVLLVSVIECANLRRAPLGQTCWHDRRCGTIVVRLSWAQQLQQAAVLQQRAAAGAQHFVRQAWQAPATQKAVEHTQAAAQRAWEAEATQRAVQRTRDAAERIRDAQPTRQALDKGKDLAQRLRNSPWGTAVTNRPQRWTARDDDATPAQQADSSTPAPGTPAAPSTPPSS